MFPQSRVLNRLFSAKNPIASRDLHSRKAGALSEIYFAGGAWTKSPSKAKGDAVCPGELGEAMGSVQGRHRR